MRKVFKYPVSEGIAIMPAGSKFVHFAMQNGEFMAWFEVDEEFPMVQRKIRIFGTGVAIPQFAKHLGTVLDGGFVWHLYELI